MKYGMEAIIAAGFPHEFSSIVMLKAFELKLSIALRVGQRPNSNKGFPVFPKPRGVKTKTCYDDPVKLLGGFIAYDQKNFGRNGSTPIPAAIVKPVQLQVSLNEILRDYEKGEYCNLRLVGNQLQFESGRDPARSNHIVFSIDLSRGSKPLPLDEHMLSMLTPWEQTYVAAQPPFWPAALGDFNKNVNNLYPVSYQVQNEQVKPLHVVASLDGKPITGDADILWVGVPAAHAHTEDHHEYNMDDRAQLSKLLLRYAHIYNKMYGCRPSLTKELLTFAGNAGIITPYEFFLENMVNDDLAKNVTHLLNLFQHGTDSRFWGKPSPLNARILHFHEGMAVLTENEDELVQFVSKESYLNKYYIRVHPDWDMSKWNKVVEKQLALKQPIHPKTLENYHAYCNAAAYQNKKDATYVKEKASLLFFPSARQNMAARRQQGNFPELRQIAYR